MKFNLLAQKENEMTIKLDLELGADELLGAMKQSHDDLQMLLQHKDEIKSFITDVIDTLAKRELDIQEAMDKRLEKKFEETPMQKTVNETVCKDMYWFDIFGNRKIKRNNERGDE